VFARWLKTFRKSVKQSRGDAEPAVLAFDADVLDGGDATSTIIVHLSASAYDNACSSLAFLFVECDCSKDYSPVSKNLWRKITLYKKGYHQESAKERSDLGLRTAEGKDPLPLACLIYLCKFLHCSNDPEHVAALLFLLIEWNLISRAENVVNAHVDLFGVLNDALICHVGVTKGDQEGSKHQDHPFHLFTNPDSPWICVGLAFSRYFLCHPNIINGGCKMFEGASQYEQFNTIFREIVRHPDHRNFFIEQGIHPEYFGTHSIRKGSVTHVACGITSSPPIASICIRANWKMPGVMNHYIRYEVAGDMYVGRCASGRNRLGNEFAVSNPYFDFTSLPESERNVARWEVDYFIKARMPSGAAVNEQVYAMFKYCYSSFLFHKNSGRLDINTHSQNAF
jgi:hypothetical protein